MTEHELRALAAYVDLPAERDLAPAVRRAHRRPTEAPSRSCARPGRARARGGRLVRRSACAIRDPAVPAPARGPDRARRPAPRGQDGRASRSRRSALARRRRAHRRLRAGDVEPPRRPGPRHVGRRDALARIRRRPAPRVGVPRERAARPRQEGRRASDDDHPGPRRRPAGVFHLRSRALPLPRSDRPGPDERVRLAKNVLLWQHGALTLRLEGDLPLVRALEIARSFR